MPLPPLTDAEIKRIGCIAASYRRLAGRDLVSGGDDVVAALWSAPFAILAHDIETDPIFYFANQMALAHFEMTFAALIRLPSRLSAEPMRREERAALLDRVRRHGIITDYSGVRISATGKRFRISNAAVWNVADENGLPVGQAAAFSNVTPL